jgi:hypothetical protein
MAHYVGHLQHYIKCLAHRICLLLPCLSQVTYFYRLPELIEAVKDSSSNMSSLTRALQSLGIANSTKEATALLRGGGRTPPDHLSMQCVSTAHQVQHWQYSSAPYAWTWCHKLAVLACVRLLAVSSR